MFLPERNTESRGRPPDLWRNWKRRRSRRRARRSCSVLIIPSPPHKRGPSATVPAFAGMTNGGSLLLPFLPPDLLGRVADTLALVGLRTTELADLRRDLADQALVHTFHLDRRRTLAGDLYSGRDRIDDGV